ncbi:hypothetical protein OCU04_001584 [Sclerotinia nivalis]|uniref:Secretory lipase n=1 Tax=Sclerotinia nivalis TaxID=352851 RepID=A0A9X0DQS4_9HELO|nr:hypothetical protein OCU04_001584 [Sclerotinia nivalis]
MSLSESSLSAQLLQPDIPSAIQAALAFGRSNWATGSVHTDPFYTLPLNTISNPSPPGTLLKVQESIDPTLYSLPHSVYITRIIYQSLTLTGDSVPVSAYILWPLSPRTNPDGAYQVVAWAHGTSGIFPECAPSHLRNLHQHFLAPYTLALPGYVVVATEYSGLGVSFSHHPDNEPITHLYLANPAAANDVIYSVVAARSAFPSLGSSFVSIGHSQGGGAIWAVAQHHAKDKIEGYLGGVSISPTTDMRGDPDPIGSIVWAGMMLGVKKVFPEFQFLDTFTEEGFAALNVYKTIEGDGAVGMGLFSP